MAPIHSPLEENSKNFLSPTCKHFYVKYSLVFLTFFQVTGNLKRGGFCKFEQKICRQFCRGVKKNLTTPQSSETLTRFSRDFAMGESPRALAVDFQTADFWSF